MRFRDGTAAGKALFAALLAVYLLGVGIALLDKSERVGAADVGWVMDGPYLLPTRHDAALAGLRAGGVVLSVNGVQAAGKSIRHDILPLLRAEIGEVNTLGVKRPSGGEQQVTVPVRAWEWADVLYAEGPTTTLGALFFLVGLTVFLVRPFAAGSWALLSVCCVAGGLLTVLFLPMTPTDVMRPLYFRALVGLIAFVPLHAVLAFPVAHPLLLHRPRILWLVYGLAVVAAAGECAAWYTDWEAPYRYVSDIDNVMLLVSVTLVLARSAVDTRSRDALTAQRARILLVGGFAGGVPFAVINFMRNIVDLNLIDMRFAYWSLCFFLLAISYTTVRYELLNARAAVQRAFIYAVVVVVLTTLAVLLVSLRPQAVALLLLPLLYLWPRFDERLNAWLYPTRQNISQLVRQVGERMATCTTVEELLDALSDAPRRVCDAASGAAFLSAGVAGVNEILRATGGGGEQGARLADEPLVRLMVTIRREVYRAHIALDPQYSRIADRCYACFDRLGADVLLPILRQDEVIGGLALGPRTSGDAYDASEINALSTVTQQAVQSIVRIEATERLRRRESEFADLKRFFPPQIIDQVMARGGVAGLRSQRKLVTVLFADLRGFTSFSDSVEPEEVTSTLEEYHAAMGHRIAEFSGTLERFAGDGLMVFFNDPLEQPDHADRAARMARAMQEEARRLREQWRRKGYPIDLGIGIHTGYATCGFIGYEGRRDYAVIGNVTNLAARLSDAAGPGEILISARVAGELSGDHRTEAMGEISLKGFHQPQAVFRLLA